MEQWRDFQLLDAPLEGISLIEASAGTGKSFSIAGLFLRLVVEQRIPVHEILVMTFTEAATEELRDRIRTTLRDAQEAFAGGTCKDAFLRGLVRRHGDHAEAFRLLGAALRDFDRSAIMTIHGFCRRVLKEHAFESLSMFDMELVSSQELIKAEIVDDFWRKHLYSETPLFVQYALQKGFRPASLLGLLGNRIGQPFFKVIPAGALVDATAEERAFLAFAESLRSAWPSARKEVEEALRDADGLKKNCYNSEKFPEWIAGMDAFLSRAQAVSTLFAGFEKFTTTELCHSVKKGCAAPEHPFFDLCEKLYRAHEPLLEAYSRKIMGLRAELFRFAGAELAARKRKRNVLHFDDLLLNLFSTLNGEAGEGLARVIHGQYKAALIDEFQDTDPLQYAIFRKLFAHGPWIVFLIGDPKQSIYGFRGADLFAYMEAARDVRTRFTLRENWRSSPGLIRAVNAIFGGRPDPFVYREIGFHPCLPAPGGPTQVLSIDSQEQAPLHLWVLDSDDPKGIPKSEARKAISEAVAGEIARLLRLGREGRALLGGRPLVEGDMAVLVRRNQDAVQMQRILSRLRIPSVLYSTGNLFDSHEAMEAERVLIAVTAPENGRLLRAALSTDLLGLRAEDLQEMLVRERVWDDWVVRFKHYQNLWITRGFMRMFRRLLDQENVLSRLVRFPDGERRCTNLLHLAEVLHQISREKRLSGMGLVKWLSVRRSGIAGEPEEHPIRLESDEKAVKLVTVHKSKGLEYPIVFCPFGWSGSRLRNSHEPFTFHSGDTPSGLVLDLGSEQARENRKLAEKEILAENLRLLYVNLTRAKAASYLVWGRISEAETSAPAYLLYPPSSPGTGGVVETTRETYQSLGKDFVERLKEIERSAGGALVVEPLPVAPGDLPSLRPNQEQRLSCRTFRGEIDLEHGFASFSSLIGQGGGAEPFDHDRAETGPAVSPEETQQGFFSFPAGLRAGSFTHAVFENVEFSTRDPLSARAVVRENLLRYGYETSWEDEVFQMVERVLQVPLDPDLPDLRLSALGPEDRLHEVEFYWPLKRITADRLASILSGYGRGGEVPPEFVEKIGRLEFSPLRGFMRGFMDLIFRFKGRFHLVDWKSNHLGPRIEDYGPEELRAAMQKGYYILQFLIYTVAIHQYLRLRVPDYDYDDHFGGIFYVFLRGVDPARGTDFGIFRDRPSKELIERLAGELIEQ